MSFTPSPLQAQAIDAEEWRRVAEFPAYEVSNIGRVRRRIASRGARGGHILRPGKWASGHLFVVLRANGIAKHQSVHRLVAMTFIGPAPFDGALVLHKDDVPHNNVLDNLYWGTRRDNAKDAKLNRKRGDGKRSLGGQPGEENSSAVLTEADVHEIKRQLKTGLSGACVARLYGVRKETIYSIAKGRTWQHISQEAA